jgi:hypothetical protein
MIDKLIKEGFSEKTLVKFSDKQLTDLHGRIIGESDVMISKDDPNLQKKVTDAKDKKQSIETYEEEKPSDGLSKNKKSEIVKKTKKGEDIGKKGKEFKKIEKKSKENVEVKNWIKTLAENNFHSFTSKGEIMELIQSKSSNVEFGSKVKKGHNGVPEFMTYDSIVTAAEPKEKPQTRPTETPTKDPGTKQPPKKDPRKTPFQPGPGPNPKPKALKERR